MSNRDVVQLQGLGKDGYMDVFAKSTRYECRRIGEHTGCGAEWDENRRPVSFLRQLANARREWQLDRIAMRVGVLCDAIDRVIVTIRTMSRDEAVKLGHFDKLRKLQRGRDELLKARRKLESEGIG